MAPIVDGEWMAPRGSPDRTLRLPKEGHRTTFGQPSSGWNTALTRRRKHLYLRATNHEYQYDHVIAMCRPIGLYIRGDCVYIYATIARSHLLTMCGLLLPPIAEGPSGPSQYLRNNGLCCFFRKDSEIGVNEIGTFLNRNLWF